ncbi:MAG: ThiF family adenylyltransferase [bacterium]
MDKVIILDAQNTQDKKILAKLKQSSVNITDEYLAQKQELYKIRYPHVSTKLPGRWVYYPWANRLVHILCAAEYYELRTARNNPLYSPSVQNNFHKLTIGVVGLSVGSNIVRALVYAGIGNTFKIADPDYLSTSNLNRITANLLDLGLNKTTIMSRQIWELDPYINIIIYDQGITGDNLEEFLTSPRLDLVFDEADDLVLKLHLRLAAKSAKVPYLMVTDNGYNAEIDVVRFDQSGQSGDTGDLPDVSLAEIAGALNNSEKLELSPKAEQELINTLIGSEDRAVEMKLAGKMKLSGKIAGWPQLQAVAGVGASLAVYAIKDFVSKKLKSGKKVLSLN